jgi:hypothetical protein
VTEKMATTTINLPMDLLSELRIVAIERAAEHGGRPSVSALVVDVMWRYLEHGYSVDQRAELTEALEHLHKAVAKIGPLT